MRLKCCNVGRENMSKSDLFFSIIVPVYNSEKYLRTCLDSLLQQKFEKYELLLIDNNSTDQSAKICREYQNIFNNIHLIEQRKKGASAARNIGLDNAHGKYILFVDSDDFVEPNLLNELFEVVKDFQYDLVYFNMNILNSGTLSVNKLELPYTQKRRLSKNDAYKSLLSETGYRGFVWNKLYKKRCIDKVRFDEKILYLEDGLFNIDALKNSEKILSFPAVLTNYRIHESSFVNSRFNLKQLSYLNAIDIYKEKMPKIFENDILFLEKLALLNFSSKIIFSNIFLYRELKKI